MNPLTNVRNIQKLNERMLEMGVEDSQAWHKQYKDSAYLFIGGLPFDLTEGDIICVFSQYGEIVNINLVREKSTGKSKGFCFLCYEDQRSTVLAVDNLNSIKLGGRIIRVDHCSNYRRPKSDEKDEHGNRKEIIEAGCAPKTPSPSPPPSEDEQGVIELPKKRKKEKKAKKNKKTKEEKLQKKKRLLTGPDGHEEKQRKPDLPNKASIMERDGARTGNLEKEKNGREKDVTKERNVPLDRDVRDYRQGGNTRVNVRDRDNQRDRDSNQRDRERDDKGDRYQSGSFQRQEHNTGSDRSRDMRGRDRDVRDRERYVDEREVGNMRDQNRGNNYERYEANSRRDRGETKRDRSSPQRDRTDQDHKSRGGQERDLEKRKERSERQRRDSNERDRAFDRRDKSDYDERKDRRRP